MTNRSRILVLAAALALTLVYVLPVWRITLEAPQYPEGLGMVIQIDDIIGAKPHDLNNINNLNHYIGMRRIEPDSIPELVYMPLILGALILGGLLTAGVGRRSLLYAWVGIFLAVSVAGLVDFWKWEYDYGHNLDQETAAIQIPGMSYQPPLIGSRQILNFTAHSWPGAGGWIAIAAALVGVGTAVYELRSSRREARGSADSPADSDHSPSLLPLLTVVGLAAATVGLGGCGDPQPRALAFGEEGCSHCRMTLMDDRYGTELLTSNGRVYPFDSVECLVSYLTDAGAGLNVHSVWVTDFAAPGRLIRAEDAFFLRSDLLTSPMGLGLSAFARREDRDGAQSAFGGDGLDWASVQEVVAQRSPTAHTSGHSWP